jgi:hypothetical protein
MLQLMRYKDLVSNTKMAILLVISSVILTIIVYWPSLSVPFYLDDRISLAENLLLKQNSIEPIWQVYGMRFVAYFSFWLNYQVLGQSLEPSINQILLHLHTTNLVIHVFNGLLILMTVKILVKALAPELTSKQQLIFSWLVMTIWLLHPLNTQAVTYTIQRIASLVTLFYLLALYSYVKIRFIKVNLVSVLLLISSVVLGLLTKQNFIVLFLLLYTVELVYFPVNRNKILCATLFALFTLALAYPFYDAFFTNLSNLTKETSAITRLEYFYTQLIVLGLYIYKFFLPFNLQLEIGVNLVKISTGLHFIAFIAHILIIGVSLYFRKNIPLFTFGILLFYTGHAVESFIIPITDLAFEHRTYLPNIGLVLAFVSFFYYLNLNLNLNLKYKRLKKFIMVSTCMLIVLLSLGTYKRNTLWQSPDDFYLADYQLAPENPRAMESYGLVLIKNKKFAEGEELLRKSVNKNLKSGKITVTSLNNLISVLFQQKKYQSAISTAMVALKYINKPKERSQVLSTIAFGYISLGYCDFSIGLSTSALKLNPQNTQALKYQNYCHKQLSK